MTVPEATAVVLESIKDLNASRPADQQIRPSPETILFGQSGTLDSLGLVELIVTIEDRANTAYGVSVALASDQALSNTRSPFHSVQSLSELLSKLAKDEPA